MINVVLDTNILHQEGLFSRNMQLLTRLASFDQVSISIPQLVKREYLSKIDAESVSSLQSINAKLGDMLKKARRRSLMHDELTQVQATLNNVAKHFGASIEEDFAVWQHSTKANILEFDPDQFDSVLIIISQEVASFVSQSTEQTSLMHLSTPVSKRWSAKPERSMSSSRTARSGST